MGYDENLRSINNVQSAAYKKILSNIIISRKKVIIIAFGPEYNYSMNFPPIDQYLPGEQFKQVNTLHIPHVCNYYMVSTHGRIWSKYSKIFLKPAYDKDGYACFGLSCTDGTIHTTRVHRLMLMVFDPEMGFQNLVCNHMDGNKQNNYMGNLEWCTVAYNTQHAYDHGLEKRGEEHSAAKITDAQAMQIIDLLPKVGDPPNKPIYSQAAIARMVGPNVTEKMVADIERKIAWKHMTNGIEFAHIHTRPPAFTEQDVINICNYFETHSPNGMTMKDHYSNALISIGKFPNKNLLDTVRKIYAKDKKYYLRITANRNFL